jgi:hypothetical protein
MSRLRTISLSAVVVGAVAAVGLAMAPAGASTQTDLVAASATATPSTPAPSTTPPPPGNEGCTPGFWKNHQSAWVGYSPSQTLGSVFTGLSGTLASKTLLQALNTGGGQLDALLRQAVAALLNAASPEVDYPMTEAEIVTAVNAAIASGDYETLKDQLDAANNLTAPGFCD